MVKFNIVDANGKTLLNIGLSKDALATKKLVAAFEKTTEIYTKKSRKVIPLHYVKQELIEALDEPLKLETTVTVEQLDGEVCYIGSDYL